MTKIDEIKFKEGGSISFKDDVITIAVPRKNMLEFAQEVYSEFLDDINEGSFTDWLKAELKKENE